MSFRSLPLLASAAIALAGLCHAEPEAGSKPEARKDKGPMLRFIIVSCPEDQGPLRIMSKNDEGEWRQHAEFEARPSFITDWMPVIAGRLHLTVSSPEQPVPVGSLTYPADTRRAIAVLFHDPKKKQYRAEVIDPAKAGFRKGSTLIANYSRQAGAVSLGDGLMRVDPGGRRVATPRTDANGMYRMVASYARPGEEPVLCYDRFVAANPDARDIMFLLPDRTLGMRVFRLSEFGPFE